MSGAGNDSASDLDLAIRQLLDQQAHIQSRLSVLLAAQQGVDMAVEVDMLRHKLRVLEDLVQRHGECGVSFASFAAVFVAPHIVCTPFRECILE